MSRSPLTVLFLCTGNSARSILAEALLNDLGRDEFRAYSAGSHPTGTVNPGALDRLQREGHRTEGLASKSWDRFSGSDAPEMDVVISVCDNAAGESCPIWNGSPISAHWGIPDPATAAGSDAAVREAFDLAYRSLKERIEAMVESGASNLTAETLQAIHSRASRSAPTDASKSDSPDGSRTAPTNDSSSASKSDPTDGTT